MSSTDAGSTDPGGTGALGADGTSDALLVVEDLHVSYPTDGERVPAVRGVSLHVARGEVVALVGESGSGKSTTAHAVLHLLAGGGRVDGGRLRFAGLDLEELTEKEWSQVRGRRIGLIPQDPTASLNPVARVGDQVAEVLVVHGLARGRAARARAVELLAEAGLDRPEVRARQYPSQLSGGMRQRVLIAIALAARPDLVVADEPTSALDVTVQRQILDHIGSLTRTLGTSVLLITHDLGVAADRADRIVVLQHGRVVEQGPAARVLTAPQHPYTRALLAAAPSLADPRLEVVERATAQDPPTSLTREEPLLVAEHLVKDFALPRAAGRGRRHRAVDDVGFTIGRGRTFALVGESGSGKSTTARLVLRLERPTSGTVHLDRIDLTAARGERLRRLRRRFQVVHQSPYASLDPRFTVGRSIAEPLRSFRVAGPRERAARVHELLEQVALPASYASRLPGELSGGQRQRVAIARALALQPDLVVLDEPVSALDVSVQAQILTLLADLQAEHGLSYLFISHDLAVVRQVADEVGVLHRGRLVEVGPTERVLHDPQAEHTRELVDAIPGRRARALT
ncbi:dipeptide ABC transporter ATP-binding protein [Cellulomonas soli]|uniref:ABC transporter ATP-binding protein n=1 Tax=Cellulomonas soli TaxID=931535 RepID=A0A512PDL1_9CELL|nr:ABC transporter ATP-binding protein [Cellulomonas soli]NYI60051.1 peptide/nickel transport system ATP-binding protein [Cellulomonas soli]GEP69295.1 ABC transporter ATP-binding protein [Cellulomonas soli]